MSKIVPHSLSFFQNDSNTFIIFAKIFKIYFKVWQIFQNFYNFFQISLKLF